MIERAAAGTRSDTGSETKDLEGSASITSIVMHIDHVDCDLTGSRFACQRLTER